MKIAVSEKFKILDDVRSGKYHATDELFFQDITHFCVSDIYLDNDSDVKSKNINQSINQSRMNSPLTNEVCLNTISFVIQWLTKVFHDCQVYLGQTSFAHHQQPLCVCYVGHGRVTQLIDLNCQSDKYDIYYKYYVQFSWFISIISH